MNLFKWFTKKIIPQNIIVRIIDERNLNLYAYRYDFDKSWGVSISKETDGAKIEAKAKASTFDEALDEAWLKFLKVNR